MKENECEGDQLPDDVQSIKCSVPVRRLDDCCKLVEIGNCIRLDEKVQSKKRKYYYWIFLNADVMPLVVCALEEYFECKKLRGRKTDYLASGWHLETGDCCVLVIELRHNFKAEKHFDDKSDQVRQSISWVKSVLRKEIAESDIFTDACEYDRIDQYKIIGVIIPVFYSNSRTVMTRLVTVDGDKHLIVALPPSHLKECGIDWSELLAAIGI